MEKGTEKKIEIVQFDRRNEGWKERNKNGE